jgi:hypothetical protein
LTGFSLVNLFEESKGIGAKLVKKFGEYNKPMGCDIMKEEVIICNLNNNTVQFHEFDGLEVLTLTETKSGQKLSHPSMAIVLLDSRIVVRDDNGIHIYDEDGKYSFSLQLPTDIGKIFGLLPVRANGGMLGIFSAHKGGYAMNYFGKDLREIVKKVEVKLPAEMTKPMVRFSTSLGNTLYLSDMAFDHNVVWICDLDGNIRSVAGKGGKGNQSGQFSQAAGLTVDNTGNFLCICSHTSRIQAFKSNGEFMCEVQFESGFIERPSDISINDDGLLAVTSLRGQVKTHY